jgi:hypothetical protein
MNIAESVSSAEQAVWDILEYLKAEEAGKSMVSG